MSFIYAVRSYHCDKIHFVRCYTFKNQGCNIEHSKNNNKTGSRRCSCPMSDACQAKNCSSVTICHHTSPWRWSPFAGRTTLSMFACHQTARTRCSPLMLEFWPHEAPLEPVTVEPINSRGNIGLKKRITKRFLPSWLWSSHPIILFPSLS
jgi:hypothetical protein